MDNVILNPSTLPLMIIAHYSAIDRRQPSECPRKKTKSSPTARLAMKAFHQSWVGRPSLALAVSLGWGLLAARRVEANDALNIKAQQAFGKYRIRRRDNNMAM